MDEPADQETSSALAMWDYIPYHTVGGRHEVADPAELGENSHIHQTSSENYTPLQEYHASPSELSAIPEDQENNAYGRTTPPLNVLSGQELGEYRATSGGEIVGASVSDGVADTLPCFYPSQYAPEIPSHPHYDTPTADPTCDGAEIDYPVNPPVMQLPLVLGPDVAAPGYGGSDSFNYIPPAHGYSASDRFHAPGQPFGATLVNNYDGYDGGAPTFSDPGEAHQSYLAITDSRPLSDNTQATPAIEIDYGTCAGGLTDHLSARPIGGAENEKTTYPLAGSPPVRNKSVGSQRPGKKKRSVTPDAKKHKAKSTQHKKSLRIYPRGPIQMAPPSPVTLLTRPDLCKVEQVTYKCDFQQKKRIEHLPIDFRVQGKEGIKLADAVNLHFSNLEGRDDPMFTDQSIGNSVSCRMAFKGYPECSKSRQIVTTNHKKTRDPIKREKLVLDVARRIKCYLEELEEDGIRFHIPFENMFLVRLNNVSQASWQPEIWYQTSTSTSS